MFPISFIKNVYYKSKITSVATDCGNEKENDARNKYCKFMSNSYINYSVNFLGLILNPDFSCLVASPDDSQMFLLRSRNLSDKVPFEIKRQFYRGCIWQLSLFGI